MILFTNIVVARFISGGALSLSENRRTLVLL